MTKRQRLSGLSLGELEKQQRELTEELARRRVDKAGKPMTLSEMELEVEELVGGGRPPAILAMLSRMKPEKPTPKACPRCGKRTPVKARDRERTVQSLSGPVTLKRNYHYCELCKHGFYPVDYMLGLPEEGELSAELEKRVLDFGLNDVYGNAAERWENHYPFPISDNLLRRVLDRVGRMAESADAVYLQEEVKPPPQEAPELLLVQNDGSMLCMRGTERWKEFKVAVIQRARLIPDGKDGHRFEAIGRPRYVAEMTAQAFEAALKAALRVEQSRKAGKVVWIADGAATNWALADKLAPGCIQLLDFQHALSHGVSAGKALLGEASAYLPLWQERMRTLLAQGDVDATIRELLECLTEAPDEALAVLDNLFNYYRTHQLRMRYPLARRFGLPIGSGQVESAHKHVLQTRMKRAGQLWSPVRARRMARLRALYRTAGAKALHPALRRAHWRTRTEPKAKIVPLPKRRASNR